MYFYDSSKEYIQSAFTGQNNSPEHQLPIAEFPQKNLIIEYFEPQSSEFSGELVIGSISQAYIDLESIATSTRIGVNCTQGTGWQEEKNCVCLMTFRDSQCSYYCT